MFLPAGPIVQTPRGQTQSKPCAASESRNEFGIESRVEPGPRVDKSTLVLIWYRLGFTFSNIPGSLAREKLVCVPPQEIPEKRALEVDSAERVSDFAAFCLIKAGTRAHL